MSPLDIDKLSTREKEIVALLFAGLTYRMIAEKLFISYETVKSHCKNIYRKLKVKGKIELILSISEKMHILD